MPVTFQDFTPFVDFTAIEEAVQAFFVAVPTATFVAPANEDDPGREKWTAGDGNIAFYTNFNELVFQACRPRVKIRLHTVNHVRGNYALDANGNLREKAWQGSLDFGIVSEPFYALHTALRSQVAAIIPMVLGQIAPDNSLFATTGINALLANFQVSEFWARNWTSDITPAEGAYMSLIPVELAFSVNPSAWPAGMVTV